MDILLKPDLERFVAEKVKAGGYSSASDVVNEALKALMEQDQFTSEHEAYLRREVRRGLDQLHAGQRSQFGARRIIAVDGECSWIAGVARPSSRYLRRPSFGVDFVQYFVRKSDFDAGSLDRGFLDFMMT